MKPQKLLIPSFFIVISLVDMITTVIGINYFGLIESNINAFPLAYGFFTFCLWLLLNRFVFQNTLPYVKKGFFILLLVITLIPSINNMMLILFV